MLLIGFKMAFASLAESRCCLLCERQMPTNWEHLKCLDCLGELNISGKRVIGISFDIFKREGCLDSSSS